MSAYLPGSVNYRCVRASYWQQRLISQRLRELWLKGNTFAVKDPALYRASTLRASQSISSLDGIVITSAHRAEAEEYLNALEYMNTQQQPVAAGPVAPNSPQTVKVSASGSSIA